MFLNHHSPSSLDICHHQQQQLTAASETRLAPVRHRRSRGHGQNLLLTILTSHPCLLSDRSSSSSPSTLLREEKSQCQSLSAVAVVADAAATHCTHGQSSSCSFLFPCFPLTHRLSLTRPELIHRFASASVRESLFSRQTVSPTDSLQQHCHPVENSIRSRDPNSCS
jgi:hypothetical protein